MINESMANILRFISSVQDSCDRHRVCLERRWHQEYAAYLADWKQGQNEIIKHAEMKKLEDNFHNEEIAKELEELALADSLLKKARTIRRKNEKLINGLVDLKNAPTPDSPVLSSNSTNSSHALDVNKISRRIPHSKSDFIAPSNKASVVPRSKSASVAIVPKTDLKCHNKHSSSSLRSVSANHIKRLDRATDSISVISSKDLNTLKGLRVNLPLCNEVQQKQNRLFSDSSGDIHQQALVKPSPNEFLKFTKRRLEFADFAHLKLKLWYPFLSYKNEKLLTTAKCHKLCSFKKMCNTINNIQEIMMWIDLLHLLEQDVCPNIVYDQKDVNVLRACSYLLSIFQHYSQRIPILDPNG